MNITRLEQLLKQEESENLEFKREIHLDTNQGKAKFVKELLALANSSPQDSEAYLIIGVEDKTKKILGLEVDLPEEQIQQLVADWCHPPLSFRVETVTYRGKRLGVITISGKRAPYTSTKDITDKQGKMLLRSKGVYIRRGSTIDTATPDEIVDIAQARLTGLESIEEHFSHLNTLLESWIDELRWENAYAPTPSSPDRAVETALIGALSMGTMLWAVPSPAWFPAVAFSAAFLWSIALSALRITHFGIGRSLLTAFMLGGLLLAFQLVPFYSPPNLAEALVLILLSAIGGAAAGWFLSILEARLLTP